MLVAALLIAATFPIPELDNCRDAKECALYCQIPANKAACWSYDTYVKAVPLVLGETTTEASPQPTPPPPTFPIKELGNCASLTECKAYCDIPDNFTTCTTVAKQRGLRRAATNYGQQTALLAHAKEILGCTSLQQCRAYCNTPEHSQQCQDLASKYGPAKYKDDQKNLLDKASTALGCTTHEECRALCTDPANKDRCRAFTQQHAPAAIREKLRSTRPSCTTLADCQELRVKLELQKDKKFTCTTRQECERYCQDNPATCPGYQKSSDFKNFQLQKELRTQNKAPITSPTREPSPTPAN